MKTSAKVEQEIVIKRTYIENVYEEDDDNLSFIIIKFLVYVPGQESSTFGSDEEYWVYAAVDQTWNQDTPGEASLLRQFLGIENDACIQSVLNALKDNEAITVGYTLTIETKSGHSLPTCGSCKHWSKGYCEIIKQNISGDHILPCSRELFEPKVLNKLKQNNH